MFRHYSRPLGREMSQLFISCYKGFNLFSLAFVVVAVVFRFSSEKF